MYNDIVREQIIDKWSTIVDNIEKEILDISEFKELFKRTWRYFISIVKNDSISLDDIKLLSLLHQFNMIVWGPDILDIELMIHSITDDKAETDRIVRRYFVYDFFIDLLITNIYRKGFVSGELVIKSYGKIEILFLEGFDNEFDERCRLFYGHECEDAY